MTEAAPIAKPRASRLPGVLVGIFAGGALLVIALIAGLGWYGIRELTRQARAALEGNPVIAAHIGEIESFAIDLPATGAARGAGTIVFSVRGTRGEGTIEADLETVDDDAEKVVGGVLRLADGKVLPLLTGPPGESGGPAERPGG